MKVSERVLEKKLREKVNIDGMQCGVVPWKGMTEAIFVVWQMQENLCICWSGETIWQNFQGVFRWVLRKLGLKKAVLTMYEIWGAGPSGVRQTVLSPLLFACVMGCRCKKLRGSVMGVVVYGRTTVGHLVGVGYWCTAMYNDSHVVFLYNAWNEYCLSQVGLKWASRLDI